MFERKSVVADHELFAAALARGRGQNFMLEQVREAVASAPYIRDKTLNKLTTPEVLARERDVVLAARDGRWLHAPFNSAFKPSTALSPEQARAVRRILGSADFITLFQGSAGTGKSFTLREVVRGLKDTGIESLVLAPQHQQADDLRRDGLDGAITLARALAQGGLPSRAVVILDEAGQVGAKDMLALVHRVQAAGGRLILSGDTRQHGAVVASDALRAIEQYSLLEPIRLSAIRRQDPSKVSAKKEKAFVRTYRRAVECATLGRTVESFDILDKAGCVLELPADELSQSLANTYCDALERGDKVLAVAQTWNKVREANVAIREALAGAWKTRERRDGGDAPGFGFKCGGKTRCAVLSTGSASAVCPKIRALYYGRLLRRGGLQHTGCCVEEGRV